MKVRILGNSIRFRLKQAEVEVFKTEGSISEITEFGFEPSDKLVFTLKSGEENVFKVYKSETKVTIEVPQNLAKEWAESSMVGFDESIETGKERSIKVLIEKDFACLDGSDKENEGSFPNPNLSC